VLRRTLVVPRRALAVALIAGAAALALALAGCGGSYHLTALLPDASQLVSGDRVEVGGQSIGHVASIGLSRNGLAAIRLEITDGSFVPLHAGTRAVVRLFSLSGVANRYIAITAGPNDGPPLRSGATIPLQDTQAAVDLDSVVNSLDAQTRSSLQALLHGAAQAFDGRGPAFNRALLYLDPALAQTAATVSELDRDQQAFSDLIVKSSLVVSSIASRRPALSQSLADTAAVAQALASRTRALDATLRAAPLALRAGAQTLTDLTPALVTLNPTLRAAAPVSPRLAAVLRVLSPTLHDAGPALTELDALLPSLTQALSELPALDAVARPAFAATATTLARALPIVSGARAALPDVTHGLLEGFGGTAGGYYDANGEFVRIGPVLDQTSVTGIFDALAASTATPGTTHNTARCPGAATQAAPDRSNPLTSGELPCNPSQGPP
jgi:phospholipid/cholesterol/gamma-HCH transport system substrate-binding protein